VFSLKARALGYSVGIQPRAKVLHRVCASRFSKEHVRKTLKAVNLTLIKLYRDGFVGAIWTKKYVKNQIKIIKNEMRRHKNKHADKIDIFYKICQLDAWKETLKILQE
jgi:GT2 family glycosyltransferase